MFQCADTDGEIDRSGRDIRDLGGISDLKLKAPPQRIPGEASTGDIDHSWRKIDADALMDSRGQRPQVMPGSAAYIQNNVAGSYLCVLSNELHMALEQLRRVAMPAEQIAAGAGIEERSDIGRVAYGRCLDSATLPPPCRQIAKRRAGGTPPVCMDSVSCPFVRDPTHSTSARQDSSLAAAQDQHLKSAS